VNIRDRAIVGSIVAALVVSASVALLVQALATGASPF